MPVRILVSRNQISSLRFIADEWASLSRGTTDADLAHSYREDARALGEVADALDRSEYAEAARLVRELDTIVRELIPSSLYHAVGLRPLPKGVALQ